MGIRHAEFIDQARAVLEDDLDPPAEGQLVGVLGMVLAGPFRVLLRLDLLPQADSVGAAGAARVGSGGVAGVVVTAISWGGAMGGAGGAGAGSGEAGVVSGMCGSSGMVRAGSMAVAGVP